jgi:hypothetical protein
MADARSNSRVPAANGWLDDMGAARVFGHWCLEIMNQCGLTIARIFVEVEVQRRDRQVNRTVRTQPRHLGHLR